MKKTFFAATIVFLIIALTGCGGGGSSAPPTFTTQILSIATVDGDITQTSPGVFVVTPSSTFQSVLAGIDPSTLVETRAFLDFSLATVPLNAVIVSASLDIKIDNVFLQTPSDTIPIRIDLVSFPPPLIGTDFDRIILQPLASVAIAQPFSIADVGRHTTIDVTPLMQVAQNSILSHFQIRILEDFGVVAPGLIEIDDGARLTDAPLLTVTYF